MIVLVDHHAVEGAPTARFISALSGNIEAGFGLQADGMHGRRLAGDFRKSRDSRR